MTATNDRRKALIILIKNYRKVANADILVSELYRLFGEAQGIKFETAKKHVIEIALLGYVNVQNGRAKLLPKAESLIGGI